MEFVHFRLSTNKNTITNDSQLDIRLEFRLNSLSHPKI